ncbi:MAG: endonuclease Q family protein [Thermodesulfovibrionales bacterium]
MSFIADLHIHSRYSRATSKDMTLEEISRWAQIKGIKVIGTGDLTHPEWFKEIKEKLQPSDNGLYQLKDKSRNSVPESCESDVFFMLSAEISCIYSKKGRIRKIHSIIYLPDFTSAERLNRELARIGNLSADGRPILGLDAKDLLRIVLHCSPDALFVPAHAWTPHFSVFGSESGFDSLEECFEELTQHIHAIETGLSSDPSMNWRLSSLDRITLMSNSDAHSPSKIGREANIFDTEVSYPAIIKAVKEKIGFAGTIEFFPEEGKYHYDGHRPCEIRLSPAETIRHNYLCPVCGKRVTVGVMNRVERLADRPIGFKPLNAPIYYSIIPLIEILSEVFRTGVNTKRVEAEYFNLISKLGSEFRILMETPPKDIEEASTSLIREAIERMRKGRIYISPGYDGVYGRIRIFEEHPEPVEGHPEPVEGLNNPGSEAQSHNGQVKSPDIKGQGMLF